MWRELVRHLERFFFPRSSDSWLAILRIGLGFELILYCVSLRGDWNHIFASSGDALINRDLEEAVLNAESPVIPRVGWLINLGAHLGVTESTTLTIIWSVLIFASAVLFIGLFCRTAAIVCWFLHLCAVKSAALMTYGVDNFTTIGLFYVMLAPVPDRYSLDWLIWPNRSRDPSLFGFFRRILQIHLCFIYFFSGLTKSLGIGWWNGLSLWRSLTSPPFDVLSMQTVLIWKHLLPVGGILICVLELGYPALIWPKRIRRIWLVGILAMHVGIGLMLGLYLFALVMIVLNLAAFGPGLFSETNRSRAI